MSRAGWWMMGIVAVVAVGVTAVVAGGDGGDPVAEASPSGVRGPVTCEPPGGDTPEGRTVSQIASTAREDVPSALDDPGNAGFPEPLLGLGELRSGGPPPDGIPAIDEPRFIAASEATFVADCEAVVALDIDGDARAYPIRIMHWHELVNDTVGGVPVTISYCPLCNSAVGYDRRVGERILDFGTSGMLHNSALVMYDRQTETLWSHFLGRAVIGELAGTTLDVFPLSTVAFGEWRAAHPDGLVLSEDTGVSRNYGANPYEGYDRPGTDPFLFSGPVAPGFEAKDRVIGIEVDGAAVAVPLDAAFVAGVVEVEVGERTLVVWVKPGAASPLSTRSTAAGTDIGSVGVFIPEVDGRRLTFTATPDGFVDRETGSTWNVFGEAVDGDLAGSQLAAWPHLDTFWFAWTAHHPQTAVA